MTKDEIDRLILKPEFTPALGTDMTFFLLMLLVAVIAFALGFAVARRIK